MKAALSIVLALAACGAPLRDLVAEHHYREAVCGAHDGGGGDREFVGQALDDAAGPKLNVYAVRPVQLVPLLGAATDRITARARFVRVVVDTNQLPLDGVHPTVAITPSANPDWNTLLRITGEPRPPNRIGQDYRGGANVLRFLFVIMTAGVGVIPMYAAGQGFTSSPIEVDPLDDDYKEVAPLAYALHHELEDGCHDTRCTSFFIVAPTGRATLELTMEYRAVRTDRDGKSTEHACRVERTTRLLLGELADLDGITQRVFGNRTRRLGELH